MNESLRSLDFQTLLDDLDVGKESDPLRVNGRKRNMVYYKCRHSARVPIAIHEIQNWSYLVNFAKHCSRAIFSRTNLRDRNVPGVVTALVVDNRIWIATSAKGPAHGAFNHFDRRLKDVIVELNRRFTEGHYSNLGCGEYQVIDAALKEGISSIGLKTKGPHRNCLYERIPLPDQKSTTYHTTPISGAAKIFWQP